MRNLMRVTAGRVGVSKTTYAAMMQSVCQTAAIPLKAIIFLKDPYNDKQLASLYSFPIGGARVGAAVLGG
jgi:hypothetical protein